MMTLNRTWLHALAALALLAASAGAVGSNSSDADIDLGAAIWRNDEDAVRAFLAAGGDFDSPNEHNHNTTPLHYAVMEGRTRMMQLLLDAGARVNARTAAVDCGSYAPCDWWLSEVTPLHIAINAGNTGSAHVTAMRTLIAAGASLDLPDYWGNTPLIKAAGYGKREAVRLLLASGLSPSAINAKDNDGNTALHDAAFGNHADTAAMLLDAGAIVNARNDQGATPLHGAVNGNPDIIRLLLDAGAGPHLPDHQGETAADKAERGGAFWRELAARSLHEGLPGPGEVAVDCDAWHGQLFFHAATATDVQGCLDAGAKANATDRDGFTPLHEVARLGNLAAVRSLIAAGANVNARSESGHAPLHWAAREGHDGVVAALLAAGAEADLGSRKRNQTPLHLATFRGQAEAARALLEAGADADARTHTLEMRSGKRGWWSGKAPLYIAVILRHRDVALTLIARGANLDAQYGDRGDTALRAAVGLEQADIAEALLDAGADATMRNAWGKSPLDYVDYDSSLKGTRLHRKLIRATAK